MSGSDDPGNSPEAQRLRMLEMMRAQPRPESDAPSLKAFFPPSNHSLHGALEGALGLMDKLVGTTSYIQDWRVVRSEAEHRAGTGLNPLKAPDAWIAHEMGSASNGDDMFTIMVLAFSRLVKQEDPRFYAATLSLTGGALATALPTVFLGAALTDPDHNMTLAEYARVIEAIVAWQKPVYVSVGSANYGVYDRVFDHRAWDGWMAWVPATVHAGDLPEHAVVMPLGPGTLVATQERNVVARHEAEKARANAVEIALVELGVLPTLASLQGG